MSNRWREHNTREKIEEAILSGEFEPGSRLVQLALADEYDVSQSVIREALLELQQTGLVEKKKNLGFFVADIDFETLLEAYEIREMLEGLAARRCCQNISRKELKRLRQIAERTYELAGKGDFDEMIRSDREFHGAVIDAARNDILKRLEESYRLFGMAVHAGRPTDDVHDEHLEMVEAIERNEPDEAERIAREHVREAREEIRRQSENGEFEPRWVKKTEETAPQS
ncbi:MAG: GntR family transcriptional regulator [Planctomycetes bacterium]|nr:GntR family transcriptional regulator [Planctomycetota bacterium]